MAFDHESWFVRLAAVIRSAHPELGANYYDRRPAECVARRAVQTLKQQGYRVTLERVA